VGEGAPALLAAPALFLEQTWRSLAALRDSAGDPHDGIALEYTHPQTGGALLPTMACWIQMIRPGERLRAHRHTGSAVYYVVQGVGETIIDGRRFAWAAATSSRCRPGRCTSTRTPRSAMRDPVLDPGPAGARGARALSREALTEGGATRR